MLLVRLAMAKTETPPRRCVFRFTVEWAMWGNMNALYAAVCKWSCKKYIVRCLLPVWRGA